MRFQDLRGGRMAEGCIYLYLSDGTFAMAQPCGSANVRCPCIPKQGCQPTAEKRRCAHSHRQLIHALLTRAPQQKCCCRTRLAKPGPPRQPAPPSAARPAAKRGDPAPAAAAAPRLRHGRVGKQAAGGSAAVNNVHAGSSPGKRFEGQQISMHVCAPPWQSLGNTGRT